LTQHCSTGIDEDTPVIPEEGRVIDDDPAGGSGNGCVKSSTKSTMF
jgi:hypothetical protein